MSTWQIALCTLLLLLTANIIAQEPRKINLDITGDFPRGEVIDPEIITLNGKDARENVFLPGKYSLIIQSPGYIKLTKEILISPGVEPFLLTKVLTSSPRIFQEKITYDVFPPPNSKPHQITIAPLDHPKKEKIVRPGDIIKPNSYIVRIRKENYEEVELRKHVWPDENSFAIEHELISKFQQVKVKILVSKDQIILDKVTYPLRFFIDTKEIEKHYIIKTQKQGGLYCTIYAKHKAQYFRLIAGYLYTQQLLDNVMFQSINLKTIDISQLILHLERISGEDKGKQLDALIAIEKLVNSHNKALKQTGEIEKLVDYLRKWQFSSEKHKIRLQATLQKLQ